MIALRQSFERIEDAEHMKKRGLDRDEVLQRLDQIAEHLRRGENPTAEIEELHLLIASTQGELHGRVYSQVAALAEHWHRLLPAEIELADCPDGLKEIVAQWREGMREEILAQIPLEARRRIEAGNPPYEAK